MATIKWIGRRRIAITKYAINQLVGNVVGGVGGISLHSLFIVVCSDMLALTRSQTKTKTTKTPEMIHVIQQQHAPFLHLSSTVFVRVLRKI